MKKKILFIIIGIIIIVAIIVAVWFLATKPKPVETLIKSEEWDTTVEKLKLQSKHEWKLSEDGKIECNHCEEIYEIGDKINYIPTDNSKKIELSSELTGHSEKQVVSAEDTNWVVLGRTEDGKGLLITTDKPLNQEDTIIFRGAQAYNNGVDILNTIARELYSNSEYGVARSITIDDINEYLGYTNPTIQYSYLQPNDDSVTDPKAKEIWTTTDNLTTQLKDIPIFKHAIKNGTYTPDGKNSEEALGEYYLKGYTLQTSEKIQNGKYEIGIFGTGKYFQVDVVKQDFIFGLYDVGLFSYWVATQGVSLCEDFVGFGLSVVNEGALTSCAEMYDSRGEAGLAYTSYLKPGIRPVVELYVIN